MAVAARLHGIQTVIRQASVRGDHAYRRVNGLSFDRFRRRPVVYLGYRFDRRGGRVYLTGLSVCEGNIGALRTGMLLPGQRFQVNRFYHRGRVIMAAAFPLRGFGAAESGLKSFLFRIPVSLAAGIRGDAFPLSGYIVQFADFPVQRAARHDLAVVIGDLRTVERDITPRQNFTGVTLFNLRFLDGAGVLIFVKVITAAAIRHDGIVHAVFVVAGSVHL